jgi:DNA replication ATP-dependent helicase Dna2
MDEDEDEFAADLEHVASLYDTRPIVSPSQGATYDDVQANPSAVANLSATVPVIDLVDDDSDEFGDDIDVDVFAAAEVAATQPSANTVRRTRTFP